MYYSYIEIEYVATSFSRARMDLALKLLTCYERETTVPADDRLPSPITMSRLNNQPTGAIAEVLSKLIWADARLLPSLGVVAIPVLLYVLYLREGGWQSER
jgi:hypothetical protein